MATGRLIGSAHFNDGRVVPIRIEEPDNEGLIALLRDAATRYLASDGSHGVYDSTEQLRARTDLRSFISYDDIELAKTAIRNRIVTGGGA